NSAVAKLHNQVRGEHEQCAPCRSRFLEIRRTRPRRRPSDYPRLSIDLRAMLIPAGPGTFFAVTVTPRALTCDIRPCSARGALLPGKTKVTTDNAVAYTRVTTTKQAKSGLGIEAQAEAIRAFAKAEGYRLVSHFTEHES